MSRAHRILVGLLGLAVGVAVWFPLVHLPFRWLAPAPEYQGDGVPPRARKLAARHLRLWTDPTLRAGELNRMRASNAEWDFMGRSFLAWSLANMALRDPATKADALRVIDQILEETLRLEQEKGPEFFLMPYARRAPFVMQPARSQFLDGEIALMLAMRRTIEEKAEFKAQLSERVQLMVDRMNQSPVMSAESYPDECWTFCNAIALAAIRMSDFLDGTDHSALLKKWVETAKVKLVHPGTGLLVSSYKVDGTHLDGPEGSSIWMAAHALQVVDPDFARDQYQRARKELGVTVAGFGYSREWPKSWKGPLDVDSGLVVPLLEASPGGSGLALVGAASFGDAEYLAALHASLDFAAFPTESGNGELRYSASNQVGDAVLLYSTTLGPMWKRVQEGRR
ncbi:MAG TPA: hypothetical protein VGK67_19985 [Myxococcales bacterium]|jgi:hypothetical protein